MNRKILPLVFALLFLAVAGAYSKQGGEVQLNQAIILFHGAPSPTDNKVLIRMYLPENDPSSTLRILDKDGPFGKRNTPCRSSWYLQHSGFYH